MRPERVGLEKLGKAERYAEKASEKPEPSIVIPKRIGQEKLGKAERP